MLPWPVQSTGQTGTHFYLVKLPNYLRAIHLIFYISQLELVYFSWILNKNNIPLLSIEINGHLEFKIAQILDTKLDQQRRDLLMYLIQ